MARSTSAVKPREFECPSMVKDYEKAVEGVPRGLALANGKSLAGLEALERAAGDVGSGLLREVAEVPGAEKQHRDHGG